MPRNMVRKALMYDKEFLFKFNRKSESQGNLFIYSTMIYII